MLQWLIVLNLGKIICESSKWQHIQRLKITILGANWQLFRLERIAKCSYFILSTHWFVMKIKKFLLPIWWYNRGLFPLGNKYFGIFVLNGLKLKQKSPSKALSLITMISTHWDAELRFFFKIANRPYALTSRLHNNDAMLGVKTCRAARTCCAGRAHWRSPSQSVRGPGPARQYGMQGLALWLHAWRWCTWQCLVWPPTHGGALLWRHMHMDYWLFTLSSLILHVSWWSWIQPKLKMILQFNTQHAFHKIILHFCRKIYLLIVKPPFH